MTLLRAEFGFSYTLLGVYEVVLAVGAARAGAGFAWAARHLARGVLLWWSALAVVLGAGLFTLGGGVPATRSQPVLGVVAAAAPFLLGSLADQHGLAPAFALEPVLVGICLLLLWSGLRARHSTA